MANIKISELNELETKNGEDLLAIVDTRNNETRKIKVETLAPENFELELIADEEPQYGKLVQGECYYNTTTNKIYRYVGSNTYVDLGEPKTGILYIIFSDKATFAYDGETMVSVGGGSGSQVIVPGEEITEDTKLEIEDEDFDFKGSEITDEYSESTEVGYSANYINNLNTYSTEEQRVGTWIDGKPIYRKVITGNWNGTSELTISLPSEVVLKNVYGYCSDGYKRPLNSNWGGAQLLSMIYQDNSILISQTGSLQQLTYINYEIVVEYTKTTD